MQPSTIAVTIVLSTILVSVVSANSEAKHVEPSAHNVEIVAETDDEPTNSRVRRQSYHHQHNPRSVKIYVIQYLTEYLGFYD